MKHRRIVSPFDCTWTLDAQCRCHTVQRGGRTLAFGPVHKLCTVHTHIANAKLSYGRHSDPRQMLHHAIQSALGATLGPEIDRLLAPLFETPEIRAKKLFGRRPVPE